jgi:hypothetical protein
VEIALRREHVQGYGAFEYDPVQYYNLREYYTPPPPTIQVGIDLAHHIELHSQRRYRGIRFMPVDAEPIMEDINMDRVRLSDLCWFRSIPESEVIVKEPSFHDLMDQILEIQAPKQKELREKARDQSRIIKPDMATIIRVAAR